MNRGDFLTRVRAAAAAGRAYRVHTAAAPGPQVGYVGGGPDLVARLADEVRAVGGTAHVVDDLAAARGRLAALLDEIGPRSALCWQHDLLDRAGLGVLLAERQIARLDHESLSELSPAEQRERILAADVGITSASLAIAETGSLVMMARPGRERVASLLPPVHVAVIERSQIVPDVFDLFRQLGAEAGQDLPSNLVLITGPSKTGDIELTLTTGVHGPGAWHVIVVR